MHFSPVTRLALLVLILGPFAGWRAAGQEPADTAGPNEASAALVREVQAGRRAVANAAWWGFDEKDATSSLQAAVDSGAKTVIVPKMGSDWIVASTLRLVGNQELVLQPGVVIAAMKGKFLGRGECLMSASDQENLIIRGQGSVLRMHKEDYARPPYEKAEWRHALSLLGCTNVKISGLTLRDSGGDGLYIGCSRAHSCCREIQVKDVVCDNNYRQGISVISAENLLIENTRFLNTSGASPEAGIDLEPNGPKDRLVNCVIRNCVSEGNRGGGLFVYLKPLSSQSGDISVHFEDCVVRNCGFGMGVGAIKDDGPSGFVEFKGITVDGTQQSGIYVYDKSARTAAVRFIRCAVKNAAQRVGYPIWFRLRRPQLTSRPGGVVLEDCVIVDTRNRPFLVGGDEAGKSSVSDIQGKVTVDSPTGSRVDLGPSPSNIDLRVTYLQPPKPP